MSEGREFKAYNTEGRADLILKELAKERGKERKKNQKGGRQKKRTGKNWVKKLREPEVLNQRKQSAYEGVGKAQKSCKGRSKSYELA